MQKRSRMLIDECLATVSIMGLADYLRSCSPFRFVQGPALVSIGAAFQAGGAYIGDRTMEVRLGVTWYEARVVETQQTYRWRKRWWIECPGCGELALALYLPETHQNLACRTCHRLAFATEHHPRHARSLSRNS